MTRGAIAVSGFVSRGARLRRQALDHQIQGGGRERLHVGEPIRAAGLDRDRRLDRSGDRDTTVAGRVAVAIAGWSARAYLRDAPADYEPRSRGTRQDHRAVFSHRLDPGEGGIGNVEHRAPRLK